MALALISERNRISSSRRYVRAPSHGASRRRPIRYQRLVRHRHRDADGTPLSEFARSLATSKGSVPMRRQASASPAITESFLGIFSALPGAR